MSDRNFCSSTSRNYQSYTPAVTLVGGSGNTVPVYSTNSGYLFRMSGYCHIMVLLTGDGGAEGAGTGQMNVSTPVACNANQILTPSWVGAIINGASGTELYAVIGVNTTTTMSLFNKATISGMTATTGADQSNTSREISIFFDYQS